MLGNVPPAVDVTRPNPGDELDLNATVFLSALVTDFEDGIACCEALGSRTLLLSGTDPQGASDSDLAIITVLDPPPDLPPSVLITSPTNFQSVRTDEEITLSGDVSDPEGATPLTLVWTVSVNGGPAQQVGTGNNVPWTPADTIDFSDEGIYDVTIRLTAQDPGGNAANDVVVLRFAIIN